MIKAVIFDFNGTLFWDTDFHSQAFDVFVARYLNGSPSGLKSRHLTEDDKRDHIMGQTNETIMQYIFGQSLTKQQIAELGEEKEIIYRDLCRGKVQFARGAEDLFLALRNDGIPFTIASSAGKSNFDFYYQQMPMAKWFPRESIVFNDGSFNGKPAPDIFLLAAEKLNTSPADTTIFEDSSSGVLAAENAKAGQIIVVNSSLTDSIEKKYNGIHPVIRDFREAISILGLH
ncbi:MAG: HAD-IA family hydrolase [Muribaculaceae bacterium]|jgi:beta-phosphoglucomutase|nr:HAD-IA family hydrolase [Muribaculaceae bacterium]